MQACPYDALYIDPETMTAAKCNYCAHRIDVGLEPACVNVCPEHAIISGDMDDPNTEIAELLARQPVKTRKPEKATVPNLFYIDADDASLVPSATSPSTTSLWSSQSHGVGHFAKEAEKLAFSNTDLVAELVNMNGGYETKEGPVKSPKTVEVLMDETKQVYNTPDKGILWGWEVSGYVWTKAIAAGMLLVPVFALLGGWADVDPFLWSAGSIVALIFLTLTGVLLIMDLDQPMRFVYVLLRPHWGSWLVKGGYIITVFGGLTTAILAAQYFNIDMVLTPLYYLTGALAIMLAIYTAFLFAQAKGRDFWQSPTMAIHMLVHSFMAGVAVYALFAVVTKTGQEWLSYLVAAGIGAILVNLFTMIVELTTTHPTKDAKTVVRMILKGRYKNMFWFGTILIGNIIPLALLLAGAPTATIAAAAGILILIGVYFNNHIWVEAPQRIPLS
jgi:formate-dependent nitrite reductase membrane component NrfD